MRNNACWELVEEREDGKERRLLRISRDDVHGYTYPLSPSVGDTINIGLPYVERLKNPEPQERFVVTRRAWDIAKRTLGEKPNNVVETLRVYVKREP